MPQKKPILYQSNLNPGFQNRGKFHHVATQVWSPSWQLQKINTPAPYQKTPSALLKRGTMYHTFPLLSCDQQDHCHHATPIIKAVIAFLCLLRASLPEGSADILHLAQSSHSSKVGSVPTVSYPHSAKRHVAPSKGPHRTLLGLLASCPVSTCCSSP